MPGPGPNPPSATSAYTRRSATGRRKPSAVSARVDRRRVGRGGQHGRRRRRHRPFQLERLAVAGLVHPAGLVRRHHVAQQRADAATHRHQAAEVEGAHRRLELATAARPCGAPGPPRGRGAAGSGRRDRGRPSSPAREGGHEREQRPREHDAGHEQEGRRGQQRVRHRPIVRRSPPIRSRARRRRRPEQPRRLAAIGSDARIPPPNDGSVLWGCVVSTGPGCLGTRAEVPSGLVKQAANRSNCQQAACSRPRGLGRKVSVEAASPPRAVEASLSGGAARTRLRSPERSPI